MTRVPLVWEAPARVSGTERHPLFPLVLRPSCPSLLVHCRAAQVMNVTQRTCSLCRHTPEQLEAQRRADLGLAEGEEEAAPAGEQAHGTGGELFAAGEPSAHAAQELAGLGPGSSSADGNGVGGGSTGGGSSSA